MLKNITNKRGELIRLPFLKARDQSSHLTQFVYSITLDADTPGVNRALVDADRLKPENAYGILFVQVINGGDFYLNGHWLTGLTQSTQAERWMWRQPFVVPLPSHLLKTDGTPNVLTVSQTTKEPAISISRPYFGTIAELSRVSKVLHFFGTILANAFDALCLIMGLFFIGAWMASPKDYIYAWAGGASILWSVLFMLFRLHDSVAELPGLWRWVVYLCEGGLIFLMSLFVLSFMGQSFRKWPRRAFIGLASIAPIVYALGGTGTERYLDLFWTPALLLFYVYAILRLTGYCWKTRSMLACMLVFQSVFLLTLAFHDYAVQSGLLGKLSNFGLDAGWSRIVFEPIYLAHLGMPFLLMLVGYILLVQHKENVRTLEISSEHLEEKLHQREVELGKLHEQIKITARHEAVMAERERIYQDIHDGIGSQLVKAIFSLRSLDTNTSAVVHNLQACLRDLRLVIDARPESNVDIQTTVFAFCAAQEFHLEGTSLKISYDVGTESTVFADPKVNLNVLRVLQESLNNTIKHSGATLIHIKVESSELQLTLTITDDGHCHRRSEPQIMDQLSAYGASGNKGITGLALRATDIGAKYTFNITESGAQVRLSIPIPGVENVSGKEPTGFEGKVAR